MSEEKWLEISITVPSGDANLVAEYLDHLSYGGAVVEQEVVSDLEEGDVLGHNLYATVKLYCPLDTGTEEISSSVAARMQEILPKESFSVAHREIAQEEWATSWKAWFKPIKVGPLLISPPWTKKRDNDRLIPIIIDPGMAFGTGSHETTKLCLRGIIRSSRTGDRVLDLGTGSGILAIAAAKLGASHISALDIDKIALDNAKHNVALNGVSALIEVTLGSIDGFSPEMARTFDLVVANISSHTVALLAKDLWAQLRDGGTLIVSGISSANLELVESSLKDSGMTQLRVSRKGDWRAITCVRGTVAP